MVDVEHLVKYYGEKKVLDDISFSIEDRQVVGLLGLNGAGKSTIMNILTGYLAATSGT
ncbi:MAG: ATP-binding cassette domain-containing protein, partial [Syntrophomonadaceae bacterium]